VNREADLATKTAAAKAAKERSKELFCGVLEKERESPGKVDYTLLEQFI